jgi:hypothetical protein
MVNCGRPIILVSLEREDGRMPVQCPKCGHIYEEELFECPMCFATNPIAKFGIKFKVSRDSVMKKVAFRMCRRGGYVQISGASIPVEDKKGRVFVQELLFKSVNPIFKFLTAKVSALNAAVIGINPLKIHVNYEFVLMETSGKHKENLIEGDNIFLNNQPIPSRYSGNFLVCTPETQHCYVIPGDQFTPLPTTLPIRGGAINFPLQINKIYSLTYEVEATSTSGSLPSLPRTVFGVYLPAKKTELYDASVGLDDHYSGEAQIFETAPTTLKREHSMIPVDLAEFQNPRGKVYPLQRVGDHLKLDLSPTEHLLIEGYNMISLEVELQRLTIATKYRWADDTMQRVLKELKEYAVLLPNDFNDALCSLLNFMAQNLATNFFKEKSLSEKQFKDRLAQHLRSYFGEEVYEEVKLGRGYVDLLVKGVPIELKVEKQSKSRVRMIDFHLKQAQQYAVSKGSKLGVLCILDLTEKDRPISHPDKDVVLKRGLKGKFLPIIFVIIIRGNLPIPSKL